MPGYIVPRVYRIIEFCIYRYGSCSRCSTSYAQFEMFYRHNLRMNGHTAEVDLRKLRKEGYLESRKTSFGNVIFYPTAKLIKLCLEIGPEVYKSLRDRGLIQ